MPASACVSTKPLLLFSLHDTCNNGWTCAHCVWVHITCLPLNAMGSKEWSIFSSRLSKQFRSAMRHLSQITSYQPATTRPLCLCRPLMKSFTGTEASISLNTFPSPLIIHFTICSGFFTVTWAEESFRQHSVGGCPFVSMHSICVGCLLGTALLWIGHWKARAPRMWSDRCRLVGASLLTACRQAHNSH